MAEVVQLSEATLAAFSEYVSDAEAGMERTLRGDGPFLWVEASAERTRKLSEGKTVAELWSGKRPVQAPDGLIHDWIGATWVPCTTVERTIAVMQDYDNHKNVYKPEVIESRLISRSEDDFQIHLRILKKKIVTVVLDTDHAARYFVPDNGRACCISRSTRISEVEEAGTLNENVLPPDTGHGFIWRLNSYWRLLERDGGVSIECRAITLTRDIPTALAWVIEPIVRKLPKESLIDTLESTRRAIPTDAAHTAKE